MRKVKIVCTMGPATRGMERLLDLIAAGMDVARLNFSHGDHTSHETAYREIRAAAKKAGRPIAILADLGGPKIRVGTMQNGAISLKRGAPIVLTTQEARGSAERISHSYQPLAHDVRPGDRILLDDGLLELRVTSSDISRNEVACNVVVGGILRDHKGMNLPGVYLSTPALTEKDKKDIAFAKQLGVDFFALSFVRTPSDLLEAKALAGDIPVIAKIEKPEAIESLGEILQAADGAMVARGDLGVEAGHEKVPLLQKRIIREIRHRAKPVITATQMLDSMTHNPRPTRAEVSDVANAVLDGTDAVMLSGETSVGEYPIEAVKTLDRIIREIEESDYYSERAYGGYYREARDTPRDDTSSRPANLDPSFSNAIADAVTEVSSHLELSAIAVYSESGRSAALVSAHRPSANVIAYSRYERVLNRLALYWGVKPLYGAWVNGVQAVVEQAEKSLLSEKLVRTGDNIAITFGMVLDREPFQTNVMKLWRIR